MKQFCVACREELEPVAEFINVHSGCLQIGERLKSSLRESIDGYSQRITENQVSMCEVCQVSAADLSVYLCHECFIDAKVIFRNSISHLLDSARKQRQLEAAAHETYIRETERLKQRELERFNRLASSVPENLIRVCKSCGLPIRQWDIRCGCS
jgi:rubrerythrin